MRLLLISIGVMMGTLLQAAEPLTYADIRRGDFVPKRIESVRSMHDGERYTTLKEGRINVHSYRTGDYMTTLFDSRKITPQLTPTDYQLSSDEQHILLTTASEPIYRHSFRAQYWVYNLVDDTLHPLSEGGVQQEATFSPDGKKVAFVRDNNLYMVDLMAGTEQQITTDGMRNAIINGLPDWVYEEEFSLTCAFTWSPDSRRLAYLRFDESGVREMEMNMFQGKLYPTNYRYKYPKAGEENSTVELYTYDLPTAIRTKMDVGVQCDQYLPRIGWTTGGNLLAYRLNRAQNTFEVLCYNAANDMEVIYTESSPHYVGNIDDQTLTFLPDGDRFVVRSEREGYMHLYLYSLTGGLLNRITDGAWEVTEVLGVSGDRVYYLSTESSPLKRDLYSVKLNGRDKKRLTSGDGTYLIAPSQGFRYYMATFSNTETAPRTTLHDASGRLLRTLEENVALQNRIKLLPAKEFFSFTTPEGVTLNGYMVRPADFDSTQCYPLFMTQYSGPGSQQVVDRWGVSLEDALVSEGYVVACVDGRGTGFRGTEFKKCTYQNLGKYETEDQISAARYLGGLPYIDAERIGIYGWSYGGFMALNCILQGNDIFRMAIAVAPVTSWRFYDTIYTELYNGLPQENAAGYDHYSPIHFADRLKGKLLIAHGTADDNVHVQNSYEMIQCLIDADKSFESAIYPDQNHGMGSSRHHLMERCIDFVKANL